MPPSPSRKALADSRLPGTALPLLAYIIYRSFSARGASVCIRYTTESIPHFDSTIQFSNLHPKSSMNGRLKRQLCTLSHVGLIIRRNERQCTRRIIPSLGGYRRWHHGDEFSLMAGNGWRISRAATQMENTKVICTLRSVAYVVKP